MNYRWTKRTDNLPEERTAVWTCTNDDCNGWMRDGFSFDEVPCCPQCKSAMESGFKMLPALHGSADDLKKFAAKSKQESESAGA